MAEVACELAGETLQRLKRECGGLQTLLRNNHQVFEGKGSSPETLIPQMWRTHLAFLNQKVLPHRFCYPCPCFFY